MNIERATAISLKKIPEKVKNLENIFLTTGCSLLNIHFRWGVQLFWSAFDMHVTVVPLKVA